MAINEEEFNSMKESIKELTSFVPSLQKNDTGKKPNPEEDKDKDKGKDKDNVLDDVALKLKAEEEAKRRERVLKESIAFNFSIKNFVEKYKDALPQTAARLVQEINDKNFSSEEAKANNIQKNLLVAYLAEQENLDSLPESLKERALEFKKLADDEKEKQVAKFWDVLRLGVDRKQLLKQAEEASKANGNNLPRGTEIENYESKIFSLGKQK